MSFKTSTSIKISPYYFLAFTFLFLTHCQPTETEGSGEVAGKQQQEEPAAERPPKKESAVTSITDDNVKDFLSSYAKEHSQNSAVIRTDFGEIIIQLYNNTPLHRANFLYLTDQDYFNNTWFYRVSKNHVIQAGNSDNPETIQKRDRLGDYTIPAEIGSGNIHRAGAVAAARSYNNNPYKRSDPYEFYICLGKSYTYNQLKAMEEEYNMTLNSQQMKVYASEGGAPHLDGEHTVFGQVISGMEVVEKIARVQTDEGEWPLDNIPISVEIIN